MITAQGVLWDSETQRVLLGMLIERLGGTVTFTEESVRNSMSASGTKTLMVHFAPHEGAVTLAVGTVKSINARQLECAHDWGDASIGCPDRCTKCGVTFSQHLNKDKNETRNG